MSDKIRYPFVALRDVVIFPGVTYYLEIGRDMTRKAITRGMQGENQFIIVTAQKNPQSENPGLDDVFPVAMLGEVKQVIRMPDKGMRAVVVGIRKVTLEYLESEGDVLYATAILAPEEEELEYSLEEIAMVRSLKDIFRVYAGANGKISEKALEDIGSYTDLNHLIYEITNLMPVNYIIKQNILELEGIDEKFRTLAELLNREIGIARIQSDIAMQVRKQVSENQKEYYLREELKAVYKELGQEDTVSEADRYFEKCEKLNAGNKVRKKIKEEIKRFRKISASSSESAVIRGYIETLLDYPWKKTQKEVLDLQRVSDILDRDHYGLRKVKERILESLSARMLNPKADSPILCLVGPPGTGKTSIAKSIAEALHRKYVRICLGGVRDEAEIRGHRRTYVGAMPGRIVTGIRQVKVKNPVMLFDEIDKLANDHKGDPASAMLEVLDPEQNKHFSDHYIEIPVDLSKVLFICTANSTDTISRPLLDRMEVIRLSGYTENEKFHIAKEHLLPKQMEKNGLKSNQLMISDTILTRMIRYYVKEAGVRGLERKIASVCRKAAKKIATNEAEKVSVSVRNEKEYLGTPSYRVNLANKTSEIGVVRGLAWTALGGDTLEIEVTRLKGKGKLELTGKLGDVMQESAKIAYSYVRSVTAKVESFEEWEYHLHVPEGATPKDGPSAGVTMATAFYSVVTGQKVPSRIAMTGELTLHGKVLAVGGLKEKLLAAKAAGISIIFVPRENQKDIADLEEEIICDLKIKYARHVQDIWKDIFTEDSHEI